VTTTDTIRTCVQNAERQMRRFSQRIQWTPSHVFVTRNNVMQKSLKLVDERVIIKLFKILYISIILLNN